MFESEEKIFKAEKADLWHPKWGENQTVLATAWQDAWQEPGFPRGAVAGSWSLGIVSNPSVKAPVDCGEMGQRNVSEETGVGNACRGKTGSHGSKAKLLSLT